MDKFPSRVPSSPQLEKIQKLMAEAVMRPLTGNEEMQKQWDSRRTTAQIAETFIKPNDRLSAFDRLEVYNKQYWFRLIDCFYDDFPGLQQVVGSKTFFGLAEAYIHKHPSRSFTLRNLGQYLDSFLKKETRWTKPYTALAVEVARLEWCHILAFDEPEYPTLRPEDIQDTPPSKLRLYLQPHVFLLEFAYPVDDFLIALKRDLRDAESAANAATNEKRKRKMRKKESVRKPRPKQTRLAVYRLDNVVYYRNLEAAEFALLGALQKGKTLEKALDVAAKAVPSMNWTGKVQGWFAKWSQLGWLCAQDPSSSSTPQASNSKKFLKKASL